MRSTTIVLFKLFWWHNGEPAEREREREIDFRERSESLRFTGSSTRAKWSSMSCTRFGYRRHGLRMFFVLLWGVFLVRAVQGFWILSLETFFKLQLRRQRIKRAPLKRLTFLYGKWQNLRVLVRSSTFSTNCEKRSCQKPINPAMLLPKTEKNVRLGDMLVVESCTVHAATISNLHILKSKIEVASCKLHVARRKFQVASSKIRWFTSEVAHGTSQVGSWKWEVPSCTFYNFQYTT